MTVDIVRTHRNRQLDMFSDYSYNKTVEEAVTQSLDALNHFGSRYDFWAAGFSGGKDSTATTTFIAWAIKNNLVPRPKKLLILRSDTDQELPELTENAEILMQHFRELGMDARTIRPAQNKRFYVQILGRGILPVYPGQPGRWCTRLLKASPMQEEVAQLYAENGHNKFLMITGIRLGESGMRDQKLLKQLPTADEIRIPSCSRDSGECGTGIWVEKGLAKVFDGLPIILGWRECNVYDWLQGWVDFHAVLGDTATKGHGFEQHTRRVAKMYGQHDDGSLAQQAGRYGCIGCPAVDTDHMLKRELHRSPELTPLLELSAIWKEMRDPKWRLRRNDIRFERDEKDKNMWVAKPDMGPLTMEARLYFLTRILAIHERAGIDLITKEDIATIHQMWKNNVWPGVGIRKWYGTEPHGDDMTGVVFPTADATQMTFHHQDVA